jgi:peptidoglycan/LPS O-acetylase OafA/YrhL
MAYSSRYQALDWLRAIAAMSVFIHHFYQQHSIFFEKQFVAPLLGHFGNWGVTIFFVLSGFCIHNSRLFDIEKRGGFDIRQYATRRFFRIYPAFIVCVLVCFLVGQYFTSNLIPYSSPLAIFSHLSLMSSFFTDYRGGINQVLWSVVLECHFYIMYAILWRKFSGIKATIFMTLFAIVIGAVTFIVSVTAFPQGPQRVLVQHVFLASWWVWCLGIVIAELLHKHIHLFNTTWGNRSALLIFFLASYSIAYSPLTYSLQLQRFALPFLCAGIIYFSLQDTYDFSRPKFLYFVGIVSYSLYLFHPLALLIGIQLHLDFFWQIALVFPLGLSFAVLSYYLVEEPGVKLGKAVLAKVNVLDKRYV